MTGHAVLVTSSVTFVLPYKVGSDVNDSHHDQESKDIQSMYPVWVISKLYKIIEVVTRINQSSSSEFVLHSCDDRPTYLH